MLSQLQPKILIIEDEPMGQALLVAYLKELMPNAIILGQIPSIQEATPLLHTLQPDLLLLDIHLSDGNAFQLLESLPKRQFKIIFTTAYQQYALKAFEYAAVHYLLKPIIPQNLKEALLRCFTQDTPTNILKSQTEILNKTLAQGRTDKMIVNGKNEIHILTIADLIRLEADNNYTHLYLTQNRHVLSSKTLLAYEKQLLEHGFLRVHDKHLVSINHIQKYLRGNGGLLYLSDNHCVEVSNRRKEILMKIISD
jgi:two-component system LytT family response regulator